MAGNTDSSTIRVPITEKIFAHKDEVEDNSDAQNVEGDEVNADIAYLDEEEEPELHMRTYVALAAMFLLNYAMVIALQGPPAVLTFIGRDLDATPSQTWIPNALSLVQAVLGPMISSVSDTFRVRKSILVGCCTAAFIGCAIAPGSHSIDRLIAAQTLIGVGFAVVPLAYAVPSEILPRKWRPLAQGFCNSAALLAGISGPLIIGYMVKQDAHQGWRNFYWFQFAIWGATVAALFFGYNPPQRHLLTEMTLRQKLGKLDLLGNGLLTSGLTLFIVGLNLGGALYSWKDVNTLVPLIIGGLLLIAFGVYEWRGTSTGVMHHDLFRGDKTQGRTFAICVALLFLEGIVVFSFVIFFPVMTVVLFEPDPFLQVCRALPYWICAFISCILFSIWSSKARSIRVPLFVGFVIFTAGIGSLASIQPDDGLQSLGLVALAGVGFGGPLVLVVAGVQLSAPHKLLATATAITTSARAVSIAIFTPIFSAALNQGLTTQIPKQVGEAAVKAGLPSSSLPAFITALSSGDTSGLGKISGVTSSIIAVGAAALKQAYADSLRVIYYIALPFGILACILCLFVGDLHKTMNFRVDAPVEKLQTKHHRSSREPE
ncbi:uncharacterized protein A1O9_11497 [Exophiala aquamarina CBS 119918]|uniref:Major facilitator superfamily (MFS) profile domain-containing protein n=1 Tax=Exophiala aquamarina CBS 119918 TaxID=1182545 RepID=A0A072NXZ0_9EURO|nr:uncharacterized protein A1O9_11497 [Exophiala aquamarina CBS 119918]KEF52257.1 hypothetical protein A1O9_11497 [Exophiala aquamarina CBS 119918]